MPKYKYPAIFSKDSEGYYYVNFPDIPSCFTDGNTLLEAIENAKEVLALMLYKEKNIPEATPIKEIKAKDNEFIILVCCNSDNYKIMECNENE